MAILKRAGRAIWNFLYVVGQRRAQYIQRFGGGLY